MIPQFKDHCNLDNDISLEYDYCHSQQEKDERSMQFKMKQTGKTIEDIIFEADSAIEDSQQGFMPL